jgi:hypothetical protein
MGFFSRDKPSQAPKVERPIVVQPADLAGFSAGLEALMRVLYGPSDAAIRGAIRALSESVGGSDPWSVGFQPGDSTRLWRWSAQACPLANEQGEYGLAPRVSIFTLWWKMTSPKMTINDFADMWLDPIPPDAEQAIWQATAEAISHLADDYTVAQTANEVITAGMVRRTVEASIGV